MASILWTNFTSGETGPDLAGRIDLSIYYNGCRVMENMIPTVAGMAARRPGTRLAALAHDAAERSTLIPFRFNVEQAYILEFADGAMEVFRDKAKVTGGTLPLAVPWSDTEAPDLRWAHSGDVHYLVHPAHPPRKLSRTGHNAWSLAEFDFTDGPYFPENTGATTLQFSAGTGTGVTLTASATAGINGGDGFLATDVGRIGRWKQSGTWGVFRITAVASTTSATVSWTTDPGGSGLTNPATTWRLGLYSDTTGWPASVTIHQERMCFGSAVRGSFPRIDGSITGGFEIFRPTGKTGSLDDVVSDDNAVAYIVATEDVAVIQDLVSMVDLWALTTTSPVRVTAGAIDEPLTPTNTLALPLGHAGAGAVRAVKAKGDIIYVDFHRLRLAGLSYTEHGPAARNLSRRAAHMALAGAGGGSGLTRLAWQENPWDTAWAVRADGALIGLTYEPDEETIAFHRHYLGGAATGQPEGAGHAVVESVAAIPGAAGDELWLAVRRTVDGATVRTIEVLETPLADDAAQEDAWYLDAALGLDNTGAALAAGCTLTPAATTGEAVTFTASEAVFAGGDEGRRIKYRHRRIRAPGEEEPPDNRRWVYETAEARILSVDSATEVTARIDKPFPSTDTIPADAWRLTVDAVTGLGHLEGETVAVLGDGAVQAPQVVTAGAIDLEAPAATVLVGLPYRSRLRPNRPEAEGRLFGRKQRVVEARIRLHRSMTPRTGPDADRRRQLPSRTTADEVGFRVPLVTGDVPVSGFPAGRDRQGTIEIDMDGEPWPLNVVAVGWTLEATS